MTHRATHPGRLELAQLIAEGVSPWLDGVHRGQIASGHLTRLVSRTGIRGVVSDVTVLARAVADDGAYRRQLARLATRRAHPDDAVRAVTAEDARLACDTLRKVYDETCARDGHVSVDLDPRLAHDADATVAEAEEVFRQVDRPNALVKIPATGEGLLAVSRCLGLGMGVHVTGVLSPGVYSAVLDAYVEGLERALAAGHRLSLISSVASLPVGRLDAEIDARLDELGSPGARELRGTAALASARLLYRVHDERHDCERWSALAAAGAHPQRLMWTATVSDTTAADADRTAGATADATADAAAPQQGAERRPGRYVEDFVSWGTVNAMPAASLRAAARHCELRGDTLLGQHQAAQEVLDGLTRLGIAYDAVIRGLEAQYAERLASSWQDLRSSVDSRLRSARATSP